MRIVHYPYIKDCQWWVVWPVDSLTPGNQYLFKLKYKAWYEEQGVPIRDRSIHHMDLSLCYVGFQTEIDALTFVLVFSEDIAK